MSKKKLVFFVPQLVGGGAEKVSINIMRILDKNMFEIHLVVVNSDGPALTYLSDNIILHDLEVSKTIFSIWKLRKIILKLKPDILFSSLIRGHIALNLAMMGLKNKPFTILRSPNSPKLLLENNQISYLQKYLLEIAYRRSNLILAQTPEMKEEIIKYHGVDRDKVRFLLNPIDDYAIDAKLKNLKTPFDSTNTNVVAAGRIIYQKGFDILIKSFENVVKQKPSFKLYIIGQDVNDEQKKLQKLIDELGLTHNIVFLGYQLNPYMYFYFSDLYVLSSRWEGLPNTVLENLYLKKPVVSTRCIPFMESLIQEGKNGFLVDVDDIVGLSNAILNFKSLELEFSNSINTNNEVNKFFTNILNI